MLLIQKTEFVNSWVHRIMLSYLANFPWRIQRSFVRTFFSSEAKCSMTLLLSYQPPEKVISLPLCYSTLTVLYLNCLREDVLALLLTPVSPHAFWGPLALGRRAQHQCWASQARQEHPREGSRCLWDWLGAACGTWPWPLTRGKYF